MNGILLQAGAERGSGSGMVSYLEFEKPVAALDAKISELRDAAGEDGSVDISKAVSYTHLTLPTIYSV